MSGYIEGVDREQVTLFPERLEDWIGEDHPVRVIDAFVDALDLSAAGFDRTAPAQTGPPRVSSFGSAEALHLWIHEPGCVEPPAGTGSGPQCRGDVADRQAGARSQDDCRLSEG